MSRGVNKRYNTLRVALSLWVKFVTTMMQRFVRAISFLAVIITERILI